MSASHALNQFEVVKSRSPMCTDAYDHGILASTVCEGLRSPRKAISPSEAKSEGIRCVKGSLLALGMEAAIALSIFGIWEAWRTFR
jgi:hypothetical protein